MKMYYRLAAALCGFALASLSAQAQFYKLHNTDIGGGVIGQFTTPLPAGNASDVTQYTQDSLGGMFTVRTHPKPWAGVEFNYAYNRYSQYYTAPTYTARLQNNTHEATAAYLFHPHFRKLQPFVAIGGGAIDFAPIGSGSNQWRGAGLVEVGLDIPTSNPHFGFKVQGRELIYRAPNFGEPLLASREWTSTAEPSAGVWYRF